MLTQIQVKDFALIDTLTLELEPGLTVLTGETGAGKSIIIDALELALGERADAQAIRHGAERCEINVSFALSQLPQAKQWLQDHELSSDDECIIRRVISQDGRSRNMINGTPCTLQMLRELGSLLISIHGQHQHQALLKRDQQRQLLDDFAGHDILCKKIHALYQQWHQTQQTLLELEQSQKDRAARTELLQFHLQELESLNLRAAEIPELEQEQKKLANAEQLMGRGQQALELLRDNENNNLLRLLHNSKQLLQPISDLDAKIATANEALDTAAIHLNEAAEQLQDFLDQLDIDEKHAQWVENRLDTIYQLARKHQVNAADLPALTARFAAELAQLSQLDEKITATQKQLQTVNEAYQQQAQQLRHSRQQAANKLAKLVTEKMQQLGFSGGHFAIELIPLAENEITPHGTERIEFLVSANPGQPLQALAKVASGGELSRIGLAIQVISAQKINTPTLIFDEVDVGIGGTTAAVVGKLLRALGHTAQVLCVTHLAQVASQGMQHFCVQKATKAGNTFTRLLLLDETERVQELARMLGGIKITEQTLAHAREMLQQAETA